MPYFQLEVGQAVDAPTRQFLARAATALIADLLHKRAEVTAVRIDELPAAAYFIAGEPCPAGHTAVHARLFITAGTNSAEQKAAFIADLSRLLRDAFGELAEASYTVIHEIAATDWGYAGRTQAARLAEKHLATL